MEEKKRRVPGLWQYVEMGVFTGGQKCQLTGWFHFSMVLLFLEGTGRVPSFAIHSLFLHTGDEDS